MAANTKNRKFYINVLLWPVEFTQICNLTQFEKIGQPWYRLTETGPFKKRL